MASGLIVGESLWGVLNAGLIVGFSNDAPIALVPEDFALGALARTARLRGRDRLAVRLDAAAVGGGAESD